MSTSNVVPTGTGHQAIAKVVNSLGLHLRPASALVKLASEFTECEITMSKDGQTVNVKSIMGVIMLAAEQGSELLVEATGDRSQEAVAAIIDLISRGFGEE